LHLALDTLAANGGRVSRRAAAELAYPTAQKLLSANDSRDAVIAILIHELRALMSEPVGELLTEEILDRVPERYRDELQDLPRYICVTPGAGPGSEHVLSYYASEEDWDANYQLKDRIVQYTIMSRDEARDMRDLLRQTGCANIAELLKKKKGR
jgi:hypothetical protein